MFHINENRKEHVDIIKTIDFHVLIHNYNIAAPYKCPKFILFEILLIISMSNLKPLNIYKRRLKAYNNIENRVMFFEMLHGTRNR